MHCSHLGTSMIEGNDLPIANALRSLRQAAKLSQLDLARRAGTTRQTIGALEAGSYAPTLAVALRLARALDCRVDDLFWLEQPWPTVSAEIIPRRQTCRRYAPARAGRARRRAHHRAPARRVPALSMAKTPLPPRWMPRPIRRRCASSPIPNCSTVPSCSSVVIRRWRPSAHTSGDATPATACGCWSARAAASPPWRR